MHIFYKKNGLNLNRFGLSKLLKSNIMQVLDVIQNRAIHILRDARNTTQTPEDFSAFDNFQL
jgi:hypothetical protein